MNEKKPFTTLQTVLLVLIAALVVGALGLLLLFGPFVIPYMLYEGHPGH